MGSWRAGLIVTCVNPLHTPNERARQLNDCSAKALVTLWSPAAQLETLLEAGPVVTILWIDAADVLGGAQGAAPSTKGFLRFPDLASPVTVPPVSEWPVALYPYTGGTTEIQAARPSSPAWPPTRC